MNRLRFACDIAATASKRQHTTKGIAAGREREMAAARGRERHASSLTAADHRYWLKKIRRKWPKAARQQRPDCDH